MPPLEFFRLQTRQEVLALYDRFAPVGVEELDLAAACGRVLAAPITAPEDVPGFLRATMDGYAVRAQDTFGAGVGAAPVPGNHRGSPHGRRPHPRRGPG